MRPRPLAVHLTTRLIARAGRLSRRPLPLRTLPLVVAAMSFAGTGYGVAGEEPPCYRWIYGVPGNPYMIVGDTKEAVCWTHKDDFCGPPNYDCFWDPTHYWGPQHAWGGDCRQRNDAGECIEARCHWKRRSFPAPGYALSTSRQSCAVVPERPLPGKNAGRACPANGIASEEGNPINVGTGNKYQREVDYAGPGPMALRLVRHYNSDYSPEAELGEHWRHTYDRRLERSDVAVMVAYRPDGRMLAFHRTESGWRPDPDIEARLERLTDPAGETRGWAYTTAGDVAERYDADGRLVSMTRRSGYAQTLGYDADGRLVSVTDSFGRELAFTYDRRGRVNAVTLPGGGVYRYHYAARNLVEVEQPGGVSRRYHYEDDRHPHALTGITDENGHRLATYAYDEQGRAVLSEHAGGAGRIAVDYHGDGSATVRDAAGAVRTYRFDIIRGVVKATAVEGDPCTSCGSRLAASDYDADGRVTRTVDRNGHVATYEHNDRGLEVRRTEALGTPAERTIATQWHSQFRLPVRIAEPGRVTAFAYDERGRRVERTIT
nr:RHS repeat protein [Gammaproteobacteria bacterium]